MDGCGDGGDCSVDTIYGGGIGRTAKYVYDTYGTKDGDKAANDFRITTWGHIFRSLWIDELPMIINLLKGDMKLVGVRPLSKAKFDTYPEWLQDLRTQSKPGVDTSILCGSAEDAGGDV